MPPFICTTSGLLENMVMQYSLANDTKEPLDKFYNTSDIHSNVERKPNLAKNGNGEHSNLLQKPVGILKAEDFQYTKIQG